MLLIEQLQRQIVEWRCFRFHVQWILGKGPHRVRFSPHVLYQRPAAIGACVTRDEQSVAGFNRANICTVAMTTTPVLQAPITIPPTVLRRRQ